MEFSWFYARKNHALVAQLIGHLTAMQEVTSLTLARPTLRVLKYVRRKCCLCNYTHKING